MNFFYNLTAHLSFFILRIYALFITKIKLFVSGRQETFQKLSVLRKEDKVIWLHAASLGEFEQAMPVLEEIKKKYQNYQIVVTFFSPSGYEIRKNTSLASICCYLPFDTKANMKQFIELIDPEIAILVKYEFWPNLLNQLKKKSIRTILISGIFREKQIFFKPIGRWMRKSLSTFHHFFVQDKPSKNLLESIDLTNVSITGDTRFDRVTKILEQDNSLSFIEAFKNNHYMIVAGSTWDEDEELLIKYINESEGEKFIIAPHKIQPKSILKLKELIQKETVLYSEKEGKNLSTYTVFIMDTIGLLTKVYSYADVAYVGGAFKTGLHNILEPAVFGIPVVIGTRYHKFKEAVDLVELEGCFSVNNQSTISTIFSTLKNYPDFRKKAGSINKNYIKKNTGATIQIMQYISNHLKL